ncbi:MAG: molybdenum cofactor carrier protein [Akkermansiaceae bacterium]|nr:molybdenum cofactor carrier protein [Akkermansiaceae bacterium]
MSNRQRIVGVMGSGSERHEEWSVPLGGLLAGLGVGLLTGGGQGVMEAVAEGFVAVEERAGVSIGILPGSGPGEPEAPPGYPNRFVEVVIRTHLPGRGEEGETSLSRNLINIASADAVVILPGGAGTASETRLANRFGKPVIGFGGGGESEGIPRAGTLAEVEEFLKAALGLR